MRATALFHVLLLAGTAGASDLFGGIEALGNDLRSPSAAARREAVDRLDAYSADEARPWLARALEDADVEVRAHAALSVGRHRLRELLPRVIALGEDFDPKLRAAAVEALGLLGAGRGQPPEPALVAALERALADGEQPVRLQAVTALGRLDPAAARVAEGALVARLDDENGSVRQRACESLAKLKDARAVIPLLARVSDPSRDVRTAALDALGQLGDERAAPAMIRALSDAADAPPAVMALGRLRAAAAIGPLTRVLESGPDALKGRAVMALGQIGSANPAAGARVVEPLLGALAQGELRPAAREALLRVGAPAVAPLAARLEGAAGEELDTLVELLGELDDPRALGPLLEELTRGRAPREPLTQALARVAKSAKPEARPLAELAALLEDADVAVRRRAAEALSLLGDRRVAAQLARASADTDGTVRVRALFGLGRLKAPSTVPALLAALEAADEETEAAAARALGELGEPKSAAELVRVLARPSPRVRREAADALGRLRDPAQVGPVLRLARTGSPDVRPDALAALGGLLRGRSDPVARELCLGIAESSDAASAVEAIDVLAAMRDGQSTARLTHLLDRAGDPLVRRRVAQALGELTRDARPLVARLDADPDYSVRAEAAWALGKLPSGAPSVAALTRALASPAAPVRANAAAALARLHAAPPALTALLADGDPAVRADAALAAASLDAARPLVAHLARDENPLVRAAAARALERARPAPAGDFITLHLVDFDGAPLAGARYRLLLPDRLIKIGIADGRGVVREESVPRGACSVQLAE